MKKKLNRDVDVYGQSQRSDKKYESKNAKINGNIYFEKCKHKKAHLKTQMIYIACLSEAKEWMTANRFDLIWNCGIYIIAGFDVMLIDKRWFEDTTSHHGTEK